MHVLHGKLRDYSSTTDTASVELVHHGAIESWLDGVAVDPALNRAFLVHGADVTLTCHDPHRLAEAVITACGSSVNASAHANASGAVTTQVGRGFLTTGGTGSGSGSITFAPHFISAPDLQVAVDNNYTTILSTPTTSGATVSITGGPANSNVYYSWQAVGH